MQLRATIVTTVLSCLAACEAPAPSGSRRAASSSRFSLSIPSSGAATTAPSDAPVAAVERRRTSAEIMANVEARFRWTEAFSWTFDLYVTPPNSAVPDRNAGLITFTSPDHWRARFALPYGLEVSSDGATVTVAQPPRFGTRTTMPASESELHAAFRLFSGAPDALASFAIAPVVEAHPRNARWSWVRMTPRARHPSLQSLSLLVDEATSSVRELVVDSRSGIARHFVLSGR
ncbi:MAG: hypothetical protein U0269_07970 [Polyangiales bacterium]